MKEGIAIRAQNGAAGVTDQRIKNLGLSESKRGERGNEFGAGAPGATPGRSSRVLTLDKESVPRNAA